MSHHDEFIELLSVPEPCVAVQEEAGVVCSGRACAVESLQVCGQVVDVLSIQVLQTKKSQLVHKNIGKDTKNQLSHVSQWALLFSHFCCQVFPSYIEK